MLEINYENAKEVCFCKGVTIKDIKNSIANGATCFEDIQDATELGTGCGGCLESNRELIEEMLKEAGVN